MDDGGAYTRSPAQDWLWDVWRQQWEDIPAPSRRKGWLGVLLNGDLVDGDHHHTYQIISRDLAIQKHALWQCMEPVIRKKPDAWIIIRGTESHVGQAGAAEESFARSLKDAGHTVWHNQDTGSLTHWHFLGEINGVRIDAGHHGKGIGSRPWTEQNAVNANALEIYLDYRRARDMGQATEDYPHLAIRSHFHRYFDSGQAQPTRLVQTPAFQLATSYVHKKLLGKLADIGGLDITLSGGLDIHPRIVKARRPTPWVQL